MLDVTPAIATTIPNTGISHQYFLIPELADLFVSDLTSESATCPCFSVKG
ncbi:MAG: hypothetical protein AB4368_13240 [Xenococcaceae cyanobacterium]